MGGQEVVVWEKKGSHSILFSSALIMIINNYNNKNTEYGFVIYWTSTGKLYNVLER